MKDPFKNNWNVVAETPTHEFSAVPFNEMMLQATSWDLPSKWESVVRFIHTDGRIEEVAFTNQAKAHEAMSNHEGEYLAYTAGYLMDSTDEPEDDDDECYFN